MIYLVLLFITASDIEMYIIIINETPTQVPSTAASTSSSAATNGQSEPEMQGYDGDQHANNDDSTVSIHNSNGSDSDLEEISETEEENIYVMAGEEDGGYAY